MTSTTPFQMPFASFDPQALSKMFPMNGSVGNYARDAVNTTSESTRASMKGLQEVSAAVMAQMKEQITLSVETGQKLAETKSLQDAMTIQAGYMKSAFETGMKNFSELSELYSDALRETFAPIAKQASKATAA